MSNEMNCLFCCSVSPNLCIRPIKIFFLCDYATTMLDIPKLSVATAISEFTSIFDNT